MLLFLQEVSSSDAYIPVYFCGGILLFYGVSVFMAELYYTVGALQSLTWKATPARIIRREVITRETDDSTFYYIGVEYGYTFKNKPYTTSRLAFGITEQYYSERAAQKILEKYAPLHINPIIVYVNPSQPDDAVIKRGREVGKVLFNLFWCLCGLGGAYAFFYLARVNGWV